MNLHEYQSKQLFREYDIPVPDGHVAHTVDEACGLAGELGGNCWVVKAQVHAGGRGKGGGVKISKNRDELANYVKDMLGSNLVTPQTDEKGLPVNTVLIEQGLNIKSELYLGALIDRAEEKIVFMASAAGGMEIEEVAAKNPDAILKVFVDPAAGLQPYQCRQIAFGLGLNDKLTHDLVKMMSNLYKLFIDMDLSLVEINPLIVTEENELLALDAKINIDSNAMARQSRLTDLRDFSQEDPIEVKASRYGLNYITLDGNIACMVNGAGLAMATMDVIKLYGGEPANFLDVGGGTTADKVAEAFNIILSDPNVEAILVNIFGGIVRCDLIAEGIIAAATDTDINIPIVVRVEGTNVEECRTMLENSNLKLVMADNLSDAAEKVVNLVNGAEKQG
ncbi:MAG: ADP-forming succinate--CoA ligase subunit beta [Gammaproteobacteria bacterium]|nr:MAG: ADP-forming succinate--CoA ligase subunit beta [Gammaproteobacteria bacterium]